MLLCGGRSAEQRRSQVSTDAGLGPKLDTKALAQRLRGDADTVTGADVLALEEIPEAVCEANAQALVDNAGASGDKL